MIQCLPDLLDWLGPGALFIKPGNSLNPKFLCSKKIFEVKIDSLDLDDSLKPDSLNPADTVIIVPKCNEDHYATKSWKKFICSKF